MSEHDEQVAFFEWAEYMANLKWPELRFMFAIPNGGWRAKTTAKWLKAEGLKAGALDIFLPVPRSDFHGLFIEMKYGPNQLTAEQNYYAAFLTYQGYLVEACWGFDKAVAIVEGYMVLEAPKPVKLPPHFWVGPQWEHFSEKMDRTNWKEK